jgi:hypothetical protein
MRSMVGKALGGYVKVERSTRRDTKQRQDTREIARRCIRLAPYQTDIRHPTSLLITFIVI